MWYAWSTLAFDVQKFLSGTQAQDTYLGTAIYLLLLLQLDASTASHSLKQPFLILKSDGTRFKLEFDRSLCHHEIELPCEYALK